MMSDPTMLRSVLHPTDFTAGSDAAFAHALKIATVAPGGGRFTVIHVDPSDDLKADQSEFPHVRSTLERWGRLPPGSSREDVFNDLRVAVTKVTTPGSDVVNAIDDYIAEHSADLLVVATGGRRGVPRWIHPSLSERLARLSKTTTLFVPSRAHGFVSANDGVVRLRRILIPNAPEPPPQIAAAAACGLARMLTPEPIRVDLLHVGERTSDIMRPAGDGQFTWQSSTRAGDVVDEITAAAQDLQVDLIAMATYGHHGFLDALRGSTTEQVVRRAECPVLAVPMTPHAQRHAVFGEAPEPAPSTA